MKTAQSLSRAVVAAVALALGTQSGWVQAEIVQTEALSAQNQVELDRAKVRQFVERANVKERLQALGVQGLAATDRVEALSPDEVHALAERLDTLPAGGALSNTDLLLIGLLVLLIVIVA